MRDLPPLVLSCFIRYHHLSILTLPYLPSRLKSYLLILCSNTFNVKLFFDFKTIFKVYFQGLSLMRTLADMLLYGS